MFTAIITGVICLAVGFGIGYVVCWRNPPLSILKKAENKLATQNQDQPKS